MVKKMFSLSGTILILGWIFALLAKMQLINTLSLQLGILSAGATSGLMLGIIGKNTPVSRCEIYGARARRTVTRAVFFLSLLGFGLLLVPELEKQMIITGFQRSSCQTIFKREQMEKAGFKGFPCYSSSESVVEFWPSN